MNYGIYIIMLVFSLSGIQGDENSRQSNNASEALVVSSLAAQMIAYSNLVQTYLVAHPTASGNISDAALNTPAWLKRDSRIVNYFSAGKAYVYCNSYCPATLERELSDNTNKSFNVGTVRSGKLTRFGTVDSSFTLPAIFNDGNIVYVING